MSYFGEISEPSTRTAWEDWDDAVPKESFPELCFQSDVKTPEDIATFIILEGRYLYNCVSDQNELEHINYVSEVNLHLFKTKENNNYVCVIKDYNLVQSSEILELLKDYITKSSNVIGILTKPLVEYQVSELITSDYVLRSLHTTKRLPRDIMSDITSLEQPNIIAGVVAGALCLREIQDKSAAALVCYIDSEEQNICELQAILGKNRVISNFGQMKRNNLLNSNLYI